MTTFQYPTIRAGQKATAGLLQSIIPVMLVKAADQSVTNSATKVDATDLTFTAAANTTYLAKLRMAYWLSSATGLFQMGWAGPTGTTFQRYTLVPAGTNTTATTEYMRRRGGASSTPGTTETTNVGAWLFEDVIVRVGGTAGTVSVQFAQQVATAATSATVLADSYIELRQLA